MHSSLFVGSIRSRVTYDYYKRGRSGRGSYFPSGTPNLEVVEEVVIVKITKAVVYKGEGAMYNFVIRLGRRRVEKLAEKLRLMEQHLDGYESDRAARKASK